jgi:Xaa-Pro aminopeptidase
MEKIVNDFAGRLTALRAELARSGLDGFVLATGDEHITEFPAPYANRLAWLTGFTGSTGSAVVLADAAAMFVDGRYTSAVRAQVDARDYTFHDVPQTSHAAWLAAHVGNAARIGYDPRLFTRASARAMSEAVAATAVELVPVAVNPIDALWCDQPARPATAIFTQPIQLAGKSSTDKRREISEWLASIDADTVVLVALDSIAWLFNIRASDVDIAPLAYSFAFSHRDGTADLFVDADRLGDEVRHHLGNSVRIAAYEDFYPALERLRGRVSVDPNLSPAAVYAALERGGAVVRDDRDPAQLSKAIKNSVEISGMKQAHVRDGVALARFLHWLSIEGPKGGETEVTASAQLTAFRREEQGFHSVSFDPISAVDAHGALPHYWATAASDAPIGPNSIYLVDSGGQYPDGTTDVTRTVAIGAVTAEIRDRFTRVLKGHIAIDTAIFPAGTLGSRLDPLARLALWSIGLDYDHGTGHGVGHFLNVHEGPAYFLAAPRPGEAGIAAGMILSNEPGYYKNGAYGIRIENLVVAVEREIAGAEKAMLGFEPITLVPLDRKLIDLNLLTAAEADWVDAYHARVLSEIGPLVPAETRAWLEIETAPLRG